MASDDWSAFEDRLERRLKKNHNKQYRQSGKSVFMLKQLMSRKAPTTTKKRSGN